MYAPGIDPSAGFEFRAPTQEDLDAVAEVLLADQLADGVQRRGITSELLRRGPLGTPSMKTDRVLANAA